MRPLSIHQTSALDVSPFELLDLAAANQCQGVCIFTHFDHPTLRWPVLDARDGKNFRRKMDDLNLSVGNIEVFYVQPEMDGVCDRFKKGFELGALLGAKRAVVHVKDKDFSRGADNFGKFCEFARPYGITLGLEFWKMSGGCTTNLDEAMRVLRHVDQPNAGFALDILHLMRTGTRPADMETIDPRWISYGQLNDGPRQAPDDLFEEAIFNRGIPGSGDFPLVDWIKAAPLDLPFDVEVPQERGRLAGVTAADRVREAVAGARAVLLKAGPPYA